MAFDPIAFMEAILKALIIDEPWIGLILRGEKTWEMRKTGCHLRGWIGLIRKGSGQVVGVAEITDCLPPLEERETYRSAETKHRIFGDRQETAYDDGWRTPWVLEHARALPSPVPYEHRSGAVIWVRLSRDVTMAIMAQLGPAETASFGPDPSSEPRTLSTVARPAPFCPASISPPTIRHVRVTGGNLRNHHIYLPLDFFPPDVLGGSNKEQRAPKEITVTFCPGGTIATDLDRTKRILRARKPVAQFLVQAGLEEGDAIQITRTGPYAYEFSKAP